MIHLIKLWPRHRVSCGVWQQSAGMLWGLYASNVGITEQVRSFVVIFESLLDSICDVDHFV